jgi:hypothetical protein
MLDYIYEDYLYYIFNNAFFFFISIGVILACGIIMAVCGKYKFATGFIIFSIIAFFYGFHYSRQQPLARGAHHDCNSRIEWEALNVVQAIYNTNYFIPGMTQIPEYSDLDFSEEGSTFLENRDLKRREKLFKESEFSVKILGDVNEILIVFSCKKGKCPFYRWKCPRPFKGKFYVTRIGGSGANGWLDSYEDL